MGKRATTLLLLLTFLLPSRMLALLPSPTGLHVTHKSDTRIFVAWEETTNNLYYRIKMAPASDPIEPVAWEMSYTQSWSFCRLTPNTAYRIRLQAYQIYSPYDTSRCIDTIITTNPTQPISQLPYHCGFEPEGYPFPTEPLPFLPNGWNICLQNSPLGEDHLVELDSIAAIPDPEDVNIFELSTSNWGRLLMLTLPPIDTVANPLNTLILRFSARLRMNRALWFRVGLAGNPFDTAGFKVLDTIRFNGLSPYKDVEIPLRSLPGGSNRIALLFNPNSAMYMDDFVIERKTALPPPRWLAANQVTEASVHLQWGESQRRPQWYDVSLDPFDSLLTPLQLTVSNNNIVVSQLHPDCRYHVCVQARYGYDDDSLSSPVCTTFRTHTLSCLDLDSTDRTFTLTGSASYATNRMPVRTSGQGYLATRQLILQREIDNLGTITGIDFYYLSPDSLNNIDSCVIFMGNTTENRLPNIPIDSRQMVYTGPLHCTQGWNHFELDTAFVYTGSNIFIDVWWATAPATPGVPRDTTRKFRAHRAPYCASDLFYYGSPNNIYSHLRNDMRLHYRRCAVGDSCLNTSITLIQDSVGASLFAWNEGLRDSEWDIYLQGPTDSVPVLIDSAYPGSQYMFNNLQYGNRYLISVVPYCDGQPSPSHADTIEYLAPCPPLDSLPYILDFDATSALPTCHHTRGDAVLTNEYAYFNRNEWIPSRPDGTRYTDSVHRSLRLGKGTLILPRTSLELYFLSVSFVYHRAYADAIQVGFIPDGDTAFVHVADIQSRQTIHWEYAQISFSDYRNRQGRIALRYTGSTPVYIDSITIEPIHFCGRPDANRITFDHVTESTAIVRWEACPNAYSYTVEYGATNFAPGTGTRVAAFADSLVLTGLDPSSHYNVYIRSHCTNGDTSQWSFITGFNTLCGPIARLPYHLEFSAWTTASNTYDRPPCFQGNGISLTLTADSAGNSHSDFIFSPAYSSSVYLPIDTTAIPLSTIYLRFRARAVGLDSLATTAVGYTAAQTIMVDTMALTTEPRWHETYFENGARGNFIILNCNSLYGILIDSISITAPPSCRIPSHVNASNATDTSVTLSWISYNPSPVQIEIDSVGSILDTSLGNTVQITGLTPETNYRGRLRYLCLNGDTSGWRTFRFSTLPAVARYPWCADFEDSSDLSQWRFQRDDYYNTSWHLSAEPSGNHFFNTVDASGNSPALLWSRKPVALYRDIDFGQADHPYRLSMNLRVPNGNTTDSLHIFFVPTSYPTNDAYYPWGRHISQHPCHFNPTVTDTWQNYIFDLDTLQGIHRLVIYWNAPNGSAPVAVDDVCLLMPPCLAPTGLTTTATDTSVHIQWQGHGESEYQLLLWPLDNPAQVDTFTAHTNSFDIGGLSAGNLYSVQVRSVCDSDRISPFTPATVFNTAICSNAQYTTVGNLATSGVSLRLPVHTGYPYSYTQQIYTPSEIGRGGAIRTLSFHYDSTRAPAHKNNCRIYMSHTDKSYFSNDEGPVQGDFELVYYGEIPSRPGWNTLMLQSPYHYTDTDNLLITVVDLSGTASDSAFFSVTDAGRATSLCLFGNNSIESEHHAGASLSMSYHNTIQLGFCDDDACPKPHLLFPNMHPYHTTFKWKGDTTSLAYTLQYRAYSDSLWTTLNTTDTFLRVNAALPSVEHLVRLNRICPDSTVSPWCYLSLNVPVWHCPPIDDFRIERVLSNGVSLSWSTATGNESFLVHIFNATFDSLYTTTSSTPTLFGLEINRPYRVAVQSVCPDSNASSIWSDTLDFIIPICPSVDSAWVSAIHGTDVTIDWRGAEDVLGWIIAYGHPGMTLNNAHIDTAYQHPYTLQHLEEESDYVLLVKTLCDMGYESERWSPFVRFSTLLGISQPSTLNSQLSLFPNPTTGALHILLPEDVDEAVIEVLDITGRLLSTSTLNYQLSTLNFPFPSGIYFVRISTLNANATIRLIKY